MCSSDLFPSHDMGVMVSGVWNVPESCRGGATVALVDTRMHSVAEGTICKFSYNSFVSCHFVCPSFA